MRYALTGSPAASPRAQSIEPRTVTPSSGFTLFETLTAMLVLSIALVSLFEAHSRALKAATASADYARARIFGQGLLADTVQGWRVTPKSRSGKAGPYSWTIEVTPETASWAQVETRGNWKLEHVRVVVSWAHSRQIELDTLKLGRADG